MGLNNPEKERTEILRKKIGILIFTVFAFFIAGLSNAGEVNLPKTGQTTCYDASGNVIDCSGTGQDGEVQVGVEWPEPRFEDNGDGTLTDHLTGLVWLKNASCAGEKTWDHALTYCNNLASGSCGLTDGSVAGDWRLPNILELESLVNPGVTNPSAWLTNQGFTNVQSLYYWSATNYASNASLVWVVFMSHGYVNQGDKTDYYHVWPVRSGQTGNARTWKTGQTEMFAVGDDGDLQSGIEWPSPRFMDNDDGTITDNLTGLVWMKNANCFGTRTWSQALNDCNNLASGSCGLSDGSAPGDWRLPNRKELLSLIDFSKYNPVLPGGHFFQNVQSSYYWSSTTFAYLTNFAWIVFMDYGNVYYNHKSQDNYVWPVRAGYAGTISGVVMDSGGNPIDGANTLIWVNAYTDDPCGSCQWFTNGQIGADGAYSITGLNAGTYFLQTSSNNPPDYVNEWWTGNVPDPSSFDCSDAQSLTIAQEDVLTSIDFKLDMCGSIIGRLVDEDGLPLGGLSVEYYSGETSGQWCQALSDPADGVFTLHGLGPGYAGITINSDPGRYLAGFRRHFYLSPSENKDIGTFTVRNGAKLQGMVKREGIPLPDFEMAAGAKLVMSEADTDADGGFSFIIPPGEFTLYDQEDFYAVAPRTVTVTEGDVGNTVDIPFFPAYDVSNGDVYSGTVTINACPPAGYGVMALSFMNDQVYDLNKWGGVNPLSIGGFFDEAVTVNPYQLASPAGSTVRLMCVLYGEGPEENESITLIESRDNLSGGGTYNFSYDNSGSTVDGIVTRNGEPVFFATVAIYREPGNDFMGFAETDHTGHYLFHNVPDGTYHLAATAEDYECLVETPTFIVEDNLTLDVIELGACTGHKGDFDGDKDVDGKDLFVFTEDFLRNDCSPADPCQGDFDGDNDVDEEDLALFADELGWIGLP